MDASIEASSLFGNRGVARAKGAGGYRIGTPKFAYQKGISVGSRLAVVYYRCQSPEAAHALATSWHSV